MLQICETWAQEYGMSFNPGKSEIIQLAGKVPKERPEVLLGGTPIKWVTEVKYLGITIAQGRRKRIPIPVGKMWKCYHRIKRALDPRLPLPLKHQVLLINSDILGVALYPSAVRDMDYAKIDSFVNRILCRITGCPVRWTSATFLRAELGVPPSKYIAHQRALSHMWHMYNRSWCRNHLEQLRGPGPLQRLLGLAKLYKLDSSTIRLLSKSEWDTRVKIAVLEACRRDMSSQLAARNLPEAELYFGRRKYLHFGGALGRTGVQFRWSILQQTYPRLKDEKNRSMLYSGKNLLEVLQNAEGLRPDIVRLQEEVYRQIGEELSGQHVEGDIPSWMEPHIKGAVENVAWPNQSKETTAALLALFERVAQIVKRQLRDVAASAG